MANGAFIRAIKNLQTRFSRCCVGIKKGLKIAKGSNKEIND